MRESERGEARRVGARKHVTPRARTRVGGERACFVGGRSPLACSVHNRDSRTLQQVVPLICGRLTFNMGVVGILA